MKHEYDYTSADIPDSHELGRRARRKSSTTLAVPPVDTQRRVLPSINTSLEASKPRLACPYYKFSPSCGQKRKSCISPGFTDISRLKEHLKRYHMRPTHTCPRCSQPFEKEFDLQEHLRATELCDVRHIGGRDYGDGYDAEQARRLKERKRNIPGEDKWQEIYEILFPYDYRRPSPYCHDKLEDYRNFVRDRLSRLLCERLGASCGDVSSLLGHAGSFNLEDFMREVYEQLFGEFQALYEDEDGGLSRSMTSSPANTCPPTPGSLMEDPPSPMEEDVPARPQKRKRIDATEPEPAALTDTASDSIHAAVAIQAENTSPPIDIVVSSYSTPLLMADETMEETSFYGYPEASDNCYSMAVPCLDGSPAVPPYYAQNQPDHDFSQPGGRAGDFNFSFSPS